MLTVSTVASGAAGRASSLLTIILVLVGLVVVALALLLFGMGLKAALIKMKSITFTVPPEHPGNGPKMGRPAFAWVTGTVLAACLAFVFAADWLWVVAIVSGLLFGIVALFGDETITN